MVQIALLGHGVVGSGVAEVLHSNAKSIENRAGQPVVIKHILDLREFPELPYHDKFTKDFSVILTDPDVSIVVEVMGGIHPAYEFVKHSLEAGKSVVTSNKELVAAKGAELLALAAQNHVNFLFEASVGGGIPIIRPMHQCLAANEIDEVAGILNGTTNFILTKMVMENMPFADALAIAQSLGYAEANPAADVEGQDSCRKICILASLAFGEHIYPDGVYTQGITNITLADVHYAEQANCVIKLIGRAKPAGNGKYHVMVSPALLGKHSQLANINDVFNGILVRGNATGDVVFYGRGAGKLPTASAVVGDVVDCIKNPTETISSLHWKDSDGNNTEDFGTTSTKFYVRALGTIADAESLFGKVAPLNRAEQPPEEYAFLTDSMPESDFAQRLKTLGETGTVLHSIRLLDY